VKNTACRPKIIVSADGSGSVSQAGALLLTQVLQVTGLCRQLSAGLVRWRALRAIHDPGKIVADLAVALALGGDCLADVAVLRAEPELFGPVASDPVISRLVSQLAGDAPRALKAIRTARAAARERAWALAGQKAPGAGGGLIPVDIGLKPHLVETWKLSTAPRFMQPDLRSRVSVSAHERPFITGVMARQTWSDLSRFPSLLLPSSAIAATSRTGAAVSSLAKRPRAARP
jgi:hypothetical protein